MSDFEPLSALPESQEKHSFFHVDKLSFQKQLHIEIPYDAQQGSVQIFPSDEVDKGETQQVEATLLILPPEREGGPPVIEARFFQFSGGIELQRTVEVTKRLKDFEIIDVNGFPLMTIFDGQKKKVRLINITPALLAEHQHLPKRIDRYESAGRQLDMSQMFEKTYNTLNIEHLLKIFYEHAANFFSIEEAHEFWNKVFLQALEDAGVSESTLSYFNNSDEEQWAAHLGMLSTLHGYLAMNMDGEKRFWNQIINPEYRLSTDKQEIFRNVQRYKERKISDFRNRGWKIVDKWPSANEKPQRAAVEVALPDQLRNGDMLGVYIDPETGLQIAVRVQTNLNYGTPQGIAVVVGGRRDKEHPQFDPLKVSQENDFDYYNLTADKFGRYSEIVSISDQEEILIGHHGWVDFGSKALVIYDTPRGKKCIKLYFTATLEENSDLAARPRVVIEPHHPFLEEMLETLDHHSERKSKGRVSLNMEAVASAKAHEIATRIISVGKTIEEADKQYGVNREKTKKVPLETTVDPSDKTYQEIFKEHYNVIHLLEEQYSPTGEGTLFDECMNGLFGRDERERLRDLQQRKNEIVKVDVVSDEERVYRQKQGKVLSVKTGLAITQEEQHEFKQMLKKKVKTLYCLTLLSKPDNGLSVTNVFEEDIFLNILTKTLSYPQEYQAPYAHEIARELAFLCGMQTMRDQFEYLRKKIGLVNFVKYLPVWKKICTELMRIKRAARAQTEQDLLKKPRFLSPQNQYDQEFEDRLNRISVRIEEAGEGEVPDWILEKLGITPIESQKTKLST